jgi:hypothetical protein
VPLFSETIADSLEKKCYWFCAYVTSWLLSQKITKYKSDTCTQSYDFWIYNGSAVVR